MSQMSRLMCHRCRDSRQWRARRDSNPRPPDPKSGALSTELRARAASLPLRGSRPASILPPPGDAARLGDGTSPAARLSRSAGTPTSSSPAICGRGPRASARALPAVFEVSAKTTTSVSPFANATSLRSLRSPGRRVAHSLSVTRSPLEPAAWIAACRMVLPTPAGTGSTRMVMLSPSPFVYEARLIPCAPPNPVSPPWSRFRR